MAGRALGLWFPSTYRRDLSVFVGSALLGLRWTLIGLFLSSAQSIDGQFCS